MSFIFSKARFVDIRLRQETRKAIKHRVLRLKKIYYFHGKT